MGKSIAKLYVSVGVDNSELKVGFDETNKTLSTAIREMRGEKNKIKLQAEIDATQLRTAGKEVEALRVEYKALEKQIEEANKMAKATTAGKVQAEKVYGKDSEVYKKQEYFELQRNLEVAKLAQQQKALGAQLDAAAPKAQNFWGKMKEGAKGAQGGIVNTVAGIGKINAAIVAGVTAVSTGAGFFNLTKGAIEGGNNVYKLQQRLHLTKKEAAELSRTFSAVGMDVTSVIPVLTRLDAGLGKAGENGNATTAALQKFGVSLKNNDGSLKSYTEQIESLSDAYNRALSIGNEEEFSAEVLGARGQALIPILEEYRELRELSKTIKTAGVIDTKEAHREYLEMKRLEMQAGQLKNAFGQALTPVSDELMPKITESMGELVSYIGANKEGIKNSIIGWASALGTVADVAGGVVKAIGAVGEAINFVNHNLSFAKENQEAYLNKRLEDMGINKAKGLDMASKAGGMLGVGSGSVIRRLVEEILYARVRLKDNSQGIDTDAEAAKYAEELKKKKEQEAEALSKVKKATEEEIAAKEKAQEINKSLMASIEELTQTDLENKKNALEKQAQEMIQQGADPNKVYLFKELSSEKIEKEFRENVLNPMKSITMTDFQKEMQDILTQATHFKDQGASSADVEKYKLERKKRAIEAFVTDVQMNMNNIYRTELENRLMQIDQEAKAWKQKGVQEVQVAQWASDQKMNIQRSEAMKVLTQQKELFKAYQNGGYSALLKTMRDQAGLDASDLNVTPTQIKEFQRAYKQASENILPMFAPEQGRQFGHEIGQGMREAWGQYIPPATQYIPPSPNMTQNQGANINVTMNPQITFNEQKTNNMQQVKEIISGELVQLKDYIHGELRRVGNSY